MNIKLITLAAGLLTGFQGMCQVDWNKAIKDAKNQGTTIINNTGAGSGLTNDEVIKGLKEALSIGTKNSTASASKLDGFYKNPAIKIPFPPDAMKVKKLAESVGMKPQVDKFVMTLNRAAEEASKEAAPIFLEAVKQMTIQDGFKILKGSDDEATMYLKNKTQDQLKVKFRPIVQRAIQKVELTRYWKPVITKYNSVPGVQKMNPDLNDYVTQRALEGLFKLVAQEEFKIRKDPASRVTDLLKKVFGR